MAAYLLKRLLLLLPTLWVITLLTFFISTQAPGDPVALALQQEDTPGRFATQSANAYRERRKAMGLDRPLFYLSFSRAALSDTLHRIPFAEQRSWLHDVTIATGNWHAVSTFHQHWQDLTHQVNTAKGQSAATEKAIALREKLAALYETTALSAIGDLVVEVKDLTATDPAWHNCQPAVAAVDSAFQAMVAQQQPWRSFIPAIHWHGLDNQYHHWLWGTTRQPGLLRGHMGYSYRNQNPVQQEIATAVGYTLLLSLLAMLLAYGIAVPLGVLSAAKAGSRRDILVQNSLLLLYSLPVFWMGTLLIVALGGGDFLALFPPYGIGDTTGLTSWQAFWVRAHHLVLPLICLVYPTLAFLSRQARGGMVRSLQEDYIRTARAKGLPERQVLWRHGFRNAWLPLLTLLANVFPYAVAGSVVVEVVFSIPGMGKLTLDALTARDYPIVYGVVLLTAAMTLVGYWVSDALYSWADPRITWQRTDK